MQYFFFRRVILSLELRIELRGQVSFRVDIPLFLEFVFQFHIIFLIQYGSSRCRSDESAGDYG